MTQPILRLARVDYPGDCCRIQSALLSRGIVASIADCDRLWRAYSLSVSAGWITLGDGVTDGWLYDTLEPYFVTFEPGEP